MYVFCECCLNNLYIPGKEKRLNKYLFGVKQSGAWRGSKEKNALLEMDLICKEVTKDGEKGGNKKSCELLRMKKCPLSSKRRDLV